VSFVGMRSEARGRPPGDPTGEEQPGGGGQLMEQMKRRPAPMSFRLNGGSELVARNPRRGWGASDDGQKTGALAIR
jgi:hypothetical protein